MTSGELVELLVVREVKPPELVEGVEPEVGLTELHFCSAKCSCDDLLNLFGGRGA